MATFASFSSSKHDKSLSDSSVKRVKFKRKRYFFNSDEPFLKCANSINIRNGYFQVNDICTLFAGKLTSQNSDYNKVNDNYHLYTRSEGDSVKYFLK